MKQKQLQAAQSNQIIYENFKNAKQTTNIFFLYGNRVEAIRKRIQSTEQRNKTGNKDTKIYLRFQKKTLV